MPSSNVKYIGLDVHKDAVAVAVLNGAGKLVMESIVETKASTLLDFLRGLRGELHVTLEEGTWAAWLYDVLKPHVAELVVCNPRRNALLKEGSKSDKVDARKLAELLRSGMLRAVYHGENGLGTLRELARGYLTISKDQRRVMSRLKALYRSWGNGRQPVGSEIMLRTYFVQQWFNLSGPGVEEALYDSASLRRFVGVDLGVAPAPDETTICRFRHLLEKHELGEAMLDAVNHHLASKGIRIATGTIVDATIIHAPSSTKNFTGERDPEMHQTRKGKQWYFGLKAHIGVDSKEGIVHSVCTSAASVADKHMLADLLHGEERKVWGDGGYQGQREMIREAAPHAQDMTCRRTRFKNYVDEEARRRNTTKSRVRARVEHPFRVLKRIFGFEKVRYRGIKKNHNRLCACFALGNLYLHRKRLAPLGA